MTHSRSAEAISQAGVGPPEHVPEPAERHEQHPLELPERLQQANVRQFPNSRKRGMTGREAADFEALESSRKRRLEAREAQAAQNWREALLNEQRERVAQRGRLGSMELGGLGVTGRL